MLHWLSFKPKSIYALLYELSLASTCILLDEAAQLLQFNLCLTHEGDTHHITSTEVGGLCVWIMYRQLPCIHRTLQA